MVFGYTLSFAALCIILTLEGIRLGGVLGISVNPREDFSTAIIYRELLSVLDFEIMCGFHEGT